MSNDAAAFAEPELGDDEYQAFHAVLAASARGRAFLAEHARRARQAEIDTLLETLNRLENRMAAQTQAAPPERALQALAGLLEALRGLQAHIDLQRMSTDVARLAGLIDSVRLRLEDIVQDPARPAPAPVAPSDAAQPTALALSIVAAQALAAKADEPEMRVFKAGSIPKPAQFAGDDFAGGAGPDEDAEAGEPDLVARDHAAAVAGEAPIRPGSEDASRLAGPLDTGLFETSTKTSTAFETSTRTSAAADLAEADEPMSAEPDPLAPILTLTEEERLALFA